MRTEWEILNDILFYRGEKAKFVKVQNYNEAYNIRELERSFLKELALFLEIKFSCNTESISDWSQIQKNINDFYQNKYGSEFTFPSLELTRQIKLSEILNEK